MKHHKDMRRDIGLIGLTFVGVSGVIGSGWLFAPLQASQLAGPAAILAWLIGGIAMALLALTFAEISAMLPVPGGIARVPQFSHGNVTSMAMGWSAWVGYNTAAPIEVEAMLQYMAPHMPWLYIESTTGPLSHTGIGIACAMLLVFTVINLFGVRLFARINSSITWFKIAIPVFVSLVLLIGLGLISWLGSFGGGLDIIPFGWDLLVVSVFSLAVFVYAYHCRLNRERFNEYIREETSLGTSQ